MWWFGICCLNSSVFYGMVCMYGTYRLVLAGRWVGVGGVKWALDCLLSFLDLCFRVGRRGWGCRFFSYFVDILIIGIFDPFSHFTFHISHPLFCMLWGWFPE